MAKSEVRIDKWIWAMRIFKTRTVAAEACKKGRVSIGGAVAKPSRGVKVGDVVSVRKPPVTYSFKVKALTENRLGAKLVPDYMENVTPKAELDMLEMVRIAGFVDRRKGLGRPTKREGRDLAAFTMAMYDADGEGWDDLDDDDEFPGAPGSNAPAGPGR